MKPRLLIFFGSMLLLAPAHAHRLNEYLEATMVRLAQNKAYLEFRLTPGVDVAPTVLRLIDSNSDDSISATERQAYINLFTRNLHVTLDGSTVLLQSKYSSFPTVAEIKNGLGDIIIQYETSVTLSKAAHTLTLENQHQQAIAAYMVSCLQPSDTTIHVTGQSRSYDQSSYSLNFSIGSQHNTAQASLATDDDWAVTKSYFVHGIFHILTGYDHLLFLAALVLAATSLWQLVKVVTAFTIAHSITLTLAVLNIIHLPESIVEPFIAASIIFVALQNIFWPKQSKGNTRLIVAFFFGLFHGLGFASGMLAIMHQLPTHTIMLAILGFTIGIETGNQLVLMPLYGILKLIRNPKLNVDTARFSVVQQASSAVIALAGVYYLCVDLVGVF